MATEKLDGSNTLLHEGKAYARSVSTPSEAKWMAMVKKHHAWKVREPDVYLYGEDIYGVHSIEYAPVREDRTFYAFSLRDPDGTFASFAELETYATSKGIPVVPVLFRGQFASVGDIRAFMEAAHREPSTLGGAREGVILRLARGFPGTEFAANVLQERPKRSCAKRQTLDPALAPLPTRCRPVLTATRATCRASRGSLVFPMPLLRHLP